MRRACQSLTLALLLLAVAGSVRAESSVAVLGIEPVNAPPALATRLAAALRRRVLRTPGFVLVQSKKLDEVKLVFGCVDEKPECMARVGASLQANKLIWGTLRRARKGYTLTLRYLDVASAHIDRFINEEVSVAEAEQPDATIERLTRTLIVAEVGTIKLTCGLDGAQVLLDGVARGQTDGSSSVLLRDVPAGSRRLEVRKEGYEPWTTQAVVAGGEVLELTAVLQPMPGMSGGALSDSGRRRGGPGWTIAFWSGAAVTVGLAVGMVVSGIGVLGLEDDKDAEIRRLLSNSAQLPSDVDAKLRDPDADACSVADQAPGDLADICDKGSTRATTFNVLLVGALVSAAATGFFFYKAYLSHPGGDEDPAADELAAPARWRLLGGAGPHGARIGLSLDF